MNIISDTMEVCSPLSQTFNEMMIETSKDKKKDLGQLVSRVSVQAVKQKTA